MAASTATDTPATGNTVKLYTNPQSRGQIAHWMLEETGVPYEVELLDLSRGEHKTPDYLRINPMGKVPAIVHRGVVVTECAAICAYLADAFPEAGLAPAIDDLYALFVNASSTAPAPRAARDGWLAVCIAMMTDPEFVLY